MKTHVAAATTGIALLGASLPQLPRTTQAERETQPTSALVVESPEPASASDVIASPDFVLHAKALGECFELAGRGLSLFQRPDDSAIASLATLETPNIDHLTRVTPRTELGDIMNAFLDVGRGAHYFGLSAPAAVRGTDSHPVSTSGALQNSDIKETPPEK